MRVGLIITWMFCGIISTACGQKTSPADVPSVVLNTFNLEFKNVEDVEWEKKGNNYEVEFEIQDVDHAALISAAGKLLKYKKELEINELPEHIKTSIVSTSSGKIGDLDLLVIDNNQYYQVEIDGRLTDSYIILLESGEEVKDVIYFE